MPKCSKDGCGKDAACVNQYGVPSCEDHRQRLSKSVSRNYVETFGAYPGPSPEEARIKELEVEMEQLREELKYTSDDRAYFKAQVERLDGARSVTAEQSEVLTRHGRDIVALASVIVGLEARLEAVREPVRWFAEQMEAKLKENDHKRHWRKAEMGYLRRRLADELGELRRRLDGRYKKDITDKDWARECIREAADVANFAMMIADNVRAILDTPTPGEED